MYDRVDGSGEVQMSIEQKKIDFLKSVQTDTKSHSGATLIEHLKGVHDILKKGGAPQYLQDAGLFHSIYGTTVFQHQSTNDRDAVKELIGEQAEELVYKFSMLETPRSHSISKLNNDQLKQDLILLDRANGEEKSFNPRNVMSWKEAYDL